MKTIPVLSLFTVIIFLMSSCYSDKKLAESKSVITPLSETVHLTEGSIVYGLPRTVFTISVEMERTVEKPGPYARFAADLLGLNDVIQNENEAWEITGIIVKSNQEVDPSELYVIESNTLFQTNVLKLRKEGLILDLDPGEFNSADAQTGTKEADINQVHSFDLGSDEYFQLQTDTAYKRVNVDSSFIRIPYIVEKKKRLTVDQMAEKAARRLMEMRDGKHLILTGEANVFPQSDAAINEMNRLEKQYTELFSGKIWKDKKTFTYQIIPKKDMEKKPVILFQFSELTGPVSGTLKGAVPVMAEFIPEQKTKDLTIINKNQGDKDNPGYDKLFYRIPDIVNMKISMGNQVLFNSRRMIFQYGEVIQLPANYIIGR